MYVYTIIISGTFVQEYVDLTRDFSEIARSIMINLSSNTIRIIFMCN